jgi:hypothetical protein
VHHGKSIVYFWRVVTLSILVERSIVGDVIIADGAAPTSGMAIATTRCDGVGDGSGKAMETVWRGWRQRSIEAKGGVDDGDSDGDGVASREATEALREAAAQRAGNLGSLMAQQKNSPRLRFCVGGVTPLIPDMLLVSADIVQPIPKMWFIVSADVSQPIPIIFCINWLTSVDTNMLSLYIPPAHHYSDRAPQWRRLLFRPRLFPILDIFSTFSNMFLPLFCHGIYRSWFWFHHDISYRSRIVPMYIF